MSRSSARCRLPTFAEFHEMLDVIDNGEIYLHLLNKACLCIRKAVTLGEDFEQVAEVVSGMEGHPVHGVAMCGT